MPSPSKPYSTGRDIMFLSQWHHMPACNDQCVATTVSKLPPWQRWPGQLEVFIASTGRQNLATPGVCCHSKQRQWQGGVLSFMTAMFIAHNLQVYHSRCTQYTTTVVARPKLQRLQPVGCSFAAVCVISGPHLTALTDTTGRKHGNISRWGTPFSTSH